MQNYVSLGHFYLDIGNSARHKNHNYTPWQNKNTAILLVEMSKIIHCTPGELLTFNKSVIIHQEDKKLYFIPK